MSSHGVGDSVPLVRQSRLDLEEDEDDVIDGLYEPGDGHRRRGGAGFGRCTLKQMVVGTVVALCAAAVLVLLGVGLTGANSSTPAKAKASVIRSLDSSIDPCEDFYGHVCNKFMEENPIPDDRSSWGIFTVLDQRNSLLLRSLLQKPTEQAASNSPMSRAQRAYAACLDLDTVESLGLSPIKALLAPVQKWADSSAGLEKIVAELQLADVGVLFGRQVYADIKNSTMNTLYIEQGGLGLPDPDYYVNNPKALKAYEELLTSFLSLSGVKSNNADASASAKSIVELETSLAKISVPKEKLRDPELTYNPMTIAELQKSFGPTETFNWQVYFDALKLKHPVNKVVVTTPSFFSALANILSTRPRGDFELYFLCMYMKSYARAFPKEFRDALDKYNYVLTGAKSDVPQWQRCVWRTGNMLGMAVGRLFIDATFGQNAKNMAETMVAEILAAFTDNLDTLSWMNDATKKKARTKAEMFTHKIGYAAKVINDSALDEEYDGLEVVSGEYLMNQFRAAVFASIKSLKDFGDPVDTAKWQMDPQEVNAYYEPTRNEIVFPAGILQPPFFSPAYPMSMIFGGIGAVVGHEISHGFDDEGRKYDGTGNLADWWDASAVGRFEELAKCYVDQYEAYTIQDDKGTEHHINGRLTLGENMADNAGLLSAYLAWKDHVKHQGQEPPLPGISLTPEQLFFVNFGRVWCSHTRPAMALQRILTDPHSPPKYRVRGALQNMPEFAAAFQCKQGSTYNPGSEKRCKVW